MRAIPVDVRRVASPALDLAADLRKADVLTRLLDSQFEIGGIKFGLDAIVGLVPVAGDIASTAVGLYPIYLARKHNLGRIVVGRMLANLAVDFGVGLIPAVGDVADVFIKANRQNYELLRAAAIKRDPRLATAPRK